ncbi:MAG: 50S ribosomal protein L24 [Myxococcales bacterium]|nr:50S ribosomal protein L24 [Myxococcales bacterium]
MGARLKRNDKVVVLRGRDRGATGDVLRVLEGGRVIVSGVNLVKRHQSGQRFTESGIIEREAPIDASNVMLVDPKTDKPTRVRSGRDKDDKRVRIAAKSGSVLD